MSTRNRRIAINTGGDYCPGLEWVVAGAAMAARELSWEMVCIRDGYEGLLFPERHPRGGTFSFESELPDGSRLGASRLDPFRVHALIGDAVEEIDRSEDLLARLSEQRIEAVVSIVGRRAMSVAWKLQRRGLPTVCVPVSIENDLQATNLSFGFNTALEIAVDMLDSAKRTARATGRIAVVEVLGRFSGWLALQAGISSRADAILIPELGCDLLEIAGQIARARTVGQEPSLVVVAEGVRLPAPDSPGDAFPVGDLEARRRALSPGSEAGNAGRAIDRSGSIAQSVAVDLQRILATETFPLAIGPLLRGGKPTVTDREIGLAYGAAAIHGLSIGKYGTIVAFHPPRLEFVPLADAVNKTRTVPPDSHFLLVARALGICLGTNEGQGYAQ